MNPEENASLTQSRSLWSSLQLSNLQVWIQAAGRSLSQIGAGLIYFYIPLVFVNQVGLSAASVGFSLGLSSLTGVLGHLLGGILADSPRFGRKTTLSLSATLSVAVSLLLAVTQTLPMLTIACLLLGISIGFYWTAADAAVMDVTTLEERHQAFAVMSVAENLGNGIGILGGGLLLALVHQNHLALFVGCSCFFLAFLGLTQFAIPETRSPNSTHENTTTGILTALRDRLLITFVLANVLFTTYIAIVTSTIPLYFTNFVAGIGGGPGASVTSTANLFTWCYIGIGAILQLPIARLFTHFQRVRVLMIAMLIWAVGFALVWVTGTVTTAQLIWGVGALCMLSIASVTYKPFASAIVSELAPESLRGSYIAISSQCWAIGYFIGPIIGGWAMDQSALIADRFWLGAAATTAIGLLVLQVFQTLHLEDSSLLSKEPSQQQRQQNQHRNNQH
ncbi:MAG: MFS transporter [Leptodesmis sp.]|uniref:MFS transporter n=1 Tax=Leptodesmis sp. TaxID=3100501 RepID=UPI003D0A86DE